MRFIPPTRAAAPCAMAVRMTDSIKPATTEKSISSMMGVTSLLPHSRKRSRLHVEASSDGMG